MVLRDHGIPAEYAPTISIIDSEMLEMDMRMELAGFYITPLIAAERRR